MWPVKLACLLMYGLALASGLGWWTSDAAVIVRTVALLVLAVHAVEAVIAFKLVRRYPGPLAISICLTLLFGLVHLRPLARKAPGRTPTNR